MLDSLLNFLGGLPAELIVLIISALPVVELRGAIPVAVGVYEMPFWYAYIWSVLGNMLPVYFILIWLDKLVKWLSSHSEWWKKFFDWLYQRTYNKLVKNHETYGALALALFVAIPLPVTGAWTASIAATIFGIKPRTAFIYILLGVCCAGVIVSLLTAGVFG